MRILGRFFGILISDLFSLVMYAAACTMMLFVAYLPVEFALILPPVRHLDHYLLIAGASILIYSILVIIIVYIRRDHFRPYHPQTRKHRNLGYRY